MKVAALAGLLLACISPVFALWPEPQSVTNGSTALRLSYGFAIVPDFGDVPSDVLDAITRVRGYLFTDNLGRLVLGRGKSDVSTFESAAYLNQLKLVLAPGSSVLSITQEAQKALEDRDETYSLTLPSDGSPATITATSTLGLFRGLTTFSQLWYTYSGAIYTLSAPIQIEDYPAYPYRGLLLDTARNYFPVADILRTLDAAELVKMSEFHWHVVDSQSFPLQVPGYMELAEYGAYSPEMVYTPEDVANIVSYAGARGIDVMVEIDTPGHTAAIAEAHPDFVACNQASPWANYAAEPPSGQIRFMNSTVAKWTAGLFTAVAEMFPGTIVSTGGDEVNLPCYQYDYESMLDLNTTGLSMNAALNDFTAQTHGALIAAGKTPAVWEEQILDYNQTSLSNDTLVLVWISSDDAEAVVSRGFRVIHAPSNYFYLDCGAGEWIGDDPSGNSWCDPFKTWSYAYTFDPLANLTTDQYKYIMGGQQNLWTEQSSASNVDPILWPRAAVSAEIFWSGAGGNVDTALPRLHDVSFRMQQRGIRSIPLQPLWCALRPYACDLTA